ncbi:MAG TPA: hypothetical protein VMU83_19535 [Hanamia sp.]|nr:hypothetical protein [Hanamia sp.]
MKIKIILILFMSYAAISCNSNNDKKADVKKVISDTVSISNNITDSVKTAINNKMIWTVKNDSGNEKLIPPTNIKIDTFSSTHLIQLINENFPDILLQFIRVSHDTIYVKIPDSRKLTQGIGDTGAENYLASATYTLTASQNIKFVNIIMEPGDHAEPGVYSREDFKRLR